MRERTAPHRPITDQASVRSSMFTRSIGGSSAAGPMLSTNSGWRAGNDRWRVPPRSARSRPLAAGPPRSPAGATRRGAPGGRGGRGGRVGDQLREEGAADHLRTARRSAEHRSERAARPDTLEIHVHPDAAGGNEERFKEPSSPLADLLAVVRALNRANVRTRGDLVIVGTVQEERDDPLLTLEHRVEVATDPARRHRGSCRPGRSRSAAHNA